MRSRSTRRFRSDRDARARARPGGGAARGGEPTASKARHRAETRLRSRRGTACASRMRRVRIVDQRTGRRARGALRSIAGRRWPELGRSSKSEADRSSRKVLCGDLEPEQVGEALRQRKTDAGVSAVSGSRSISAPEAIEEMREIFLRNRGSAVLDVEDRIAFLDSDPA